MNLEALERLSDDELVARVKNLARYERGATAKLIAHLIEIKARRLHLEAGCRSLYTYCREILHYSEHESYLRMLAAKMAARFPILLDLVLQGDIHLTAIKLLAPVLTPENHREVLAEARHRTRQQIEEIVARLRPRPDVEFSTQAAPPNPLFEPGTPSAATPAAPASSSSTPQPSVVPLSPNRYKVQLTVNAATLDKLRRAKDLLRHQRIDEAEILDRALAMLLLDLEKKKFAATEQPRPGRPVMRSSRDIPAEVKRAVWERHGGRCAFVSPDGHRCSETGELEFHHCHPHGDGGLPTTQNIELRCRAHNQYEAELCFGPWRATVIVESEGETVSVQGCADTTISVRTEL